MGDADAAGEEEHGAVGAERRTRAVGALDEAPGGVHARWRARGEAMQLLSEAGAGADDEGDCGR